jgi:hypothetical protein
MANYDWRKDYHRVTGVQLERRFREAATKHPSEPLYLLFKPATAGRWGDITVGPWTDQTRSDGWTLAKPDRVSGVPFDAIEIVARRLNLAIIGDAPLPE